MKMSESGKVPQKLLNKIIRGLPRQYDNMINVLQKAKPRPVSAPIRDLETESNLSRRDLAKQKRRSNAEKYKEKQARSKGKRGKQKVHTRPKPRRPHVYRPAIHR